MDLLSMCRALARQGVPSLCYSGVTVKDFPGNALKGIRLAVLDMNLNPSLEAGSDAKASVGLLIGVVQRLIDKDNGPFVALAWTSNKTLVTEFQEGLSKIYPGSTPVFVQSLEKPQFKDVNGEYDIVKIGEQLEHAMNSAWPLGLLASWEIRVSSSSSEVTNAIGGLATRGDLFASPSATVPLGQHQPSASETWKNRSAAILRALADASGKDGMNARGCILALFETLNPLQFDQLQRMDHEDMVNDGQKLLEISPPLVHPTEEAELNTMLLVSKVTPSDRGARPGNLYRLGQGKSEDENALLGGAETQTLIHELSNLPEDLTTQKEAEAAIIPITLEITPACDFQQGKQKFARLVDGVLCPSGQDKLGKHPTRDDSFIFELPPFILSDSAIPKGSYRAIFHSNYLRTQQLADLQHVRVLARIRREPLYNILAWIGRQASRPGFVSVRTKS